MLSLLNLSLHAALVSSREEQALDKGKNRKEGGRMLPSSCASCFKHLESYLQNSSENAAVPIQTNLLHSGTASSYTCFQTRI